MVYKYKRTTTRASWTEDVMGQAIKECRAGSSIRSVSIKYNIPRITLFRHVKKGSEKKSLGRFKRIFTKEQEDDLCVYLKKIDGLFYGLTISNAWCMSMQKKKIPYPSSWDKYNSAGDEWLMAFRIRNSEIVLRTPEPTSVARARGFNRTQVVRFYNILQEELQKHKIGADSLYNMDETGIMTTTNKPPKVLSISGKKQVGVVSSTERGKLTTVICCCNATGSFVPPFMIFARKRMQERLLDGAPPGTQATCTPNGWTNGESFSLWLKFFVEHVRPSETKHVMLLLDNHESHKYYPALAYASQHNVTSVSFPPHTTHKLQPLDVAVYGPLKTYFEQEINTFQKQHPGRIVNQYDVAKLLREAYLKGASPRNGVKGFASAGIWPFNPNLFGDEDFAPSDAINTTEQNNKSPPHVQSQSSPRIHETTSPSMLKIHPGPSKNKPPHVRQIANVWSSSDDEPLDTTFEKQLPSNTSSQHAPKANPGPSSNTTSSARQTREAGSPVVGPSSKKSSHYGQILEDGSSSDNEPLVPTSKKQLLDHQYETPTKLSVTCSGDVSLTVSITKKSFENDHTQTPIYYTPNVIRPLPVACPKKGTRKQKLGKAEVRTSTPVKTEQLQKFCAAEKKATKSQSKVVSKPKKADSKQPRGKVVSKSKKADSKQYNCKVCEELYEEVNGKPTEDWIMCHICEKWAHEACTAYEGQDTYKCDDC